MLSASHLFFFSGLFAAHPTSSSCSQSAGQRCFVINDFPMHRRRGATRRRIVLGQIQTDPGTSLNVTLACAVLATMPPRFAKTCTLFHFVLFEKWKPFSSLLVWVELLGLVSLKRT